MVSNIKVCQFSAGYTIVCCDIYNVATHIRVAVFGVVKSFL